MLAQYLPNIGNVRIITYDLPEACWETLEMESRFMSFEPTKRFK
jgi:hypothetical protein